MSGVRLNRTDHGIIEAILDAHAFHGYAPTVREVGAAVGLSSPSSTVHRLAVLRDRRLIDYVDHSPRTLTVTDAGRAAVGRVDA